MEEFLDQTKWLRTKNETLLTSLPSKGELIYITSDIVDEEDELQEVSSRDIHEEMRLELLLDEIEYSSSYEAVSQIDEKEVFLKMTYYVGDYAGGQNFLSSLSCEEWSIMSDIRKVAAVDKLVYLSLFAKGLVE
jgi:hypothetical protein